MRLSASSSPVSTLALEAWSGDVEFRAWTTKPEILELMPATAMYRTSSLDEVIGDLCRALEAEWLQFRWRRIRKLAGETGIPHTFGLRRSICSAIGWHQTLADISGYPDLPADEILLKLVSAGLVAIATSSTIQSMPIQPSYFHVEGAPINLILLVLCNSRKRWCTSFGVVARVRS